VADYDDQGLSKLYPTCRDVASTNYGYDLSQYDFFYVCTAGSPAASYAGLAYVGGVGFHLANSYWDPAVSVHEFGHNLGLNHAHFWDTQAKSIIGSGQNVEYGDNNDPLGGGGNPNQYNSRYKNYLGWIDDTDVADLNVTGSGIYRLYCFDQDVGTGLRGLKFTRNASQNYWLNFRQRKTSKPALMNGVQLLWTGSGNQGSYLLDVRLKGNADDNAIVIGRTFSDPAAGFHVTPVGKGHTWPESMDLVVNVGSFPANRPPVATVRAGDANADPGQSVTFTASATDPDGDALAYYWEFGDDGYSIDNSAVTTHSFAAAGEYSAQCTVSDMKGGVARRTVVVHVGNPGTFRISGRVLDKSNRPLSGIRVSTDTAKSVFTDSDGSYTIAGLPAGSYALDAVEPLSGSLSFTHPFFNNPVTVGPNFTTADFIGTSGTSSVYAPLAAKGASWRYLDNGVDQGTAWRDAAFVDSAWTSAAAPLGYPAGAPIASVIGFGPDANNKFITTYFRRQFTVANPAAFTNLLMEVLRDDGVIVYLNGVEVFRENMPAGAVTYSTFAIATVEPDDYIQTTLSAALLVPGVNTLAAEVHQSSVTSSDIAFDAALSGLSVSNATGFNLVYISDPPDRAALSSPTNVTIDARAISGSSSVSQVEFFADGMSLGNDDAAPYRVVWNNPADGPHTLRAVASIGGVQVTSPPVTITVSAPVPPVLTTTLTIIPTNAVWKFLANGNAAPPTWANRDYNDASWLAGAAQLGYGEGDETTTISYGGSVNNKWITTYFRRAFVIDEPGTITNLSVRLLRDDGGIVYLNGVEVFRSNMPGGTVNHLTLASNAADDGKAIFGASLDPSLLVEGTNVIAVEIHQDSVTSSDVSFALGLDAEEIAPLPGVYLTAPVPGAGFIVPTNVAVRATAVAGTGLSIASVQFFEDGNPVGLDLIVPYAASLPAVTPGARQITAIATDSAGNSFTSAPVSITLAAPPTGAALVSFGDVWKYLDDGSRQGANWTARAFDDRLWKSGAARFGYGGDGEVTTVSYGPNASAKFITTYFRREFTIANPAPFDGLLLRLVRDAGAVVYLNGAEIFRDNLQPGLVSWNSLATAPVDGAEERTPIDVSLGAAALLAGTNVVAVEIHQATINGVDLGFDLALNGLRNTNTTQGVYFTSPANGAHFNAPARVPLSAYAAAGEAVTLVEYFAGPVKIGEGAVPPFAATWTNAPAGVHRITALVSYGTDQFMTSDGVTITVGSAPTPVVPVFQTLVPARSTWKYWDNLASVGAGWPQTDFNDSTWPGGPARFGFGLDGEATPLTEGRTTYYFRRWFQVGNPALINQLVFQLARDDGAVVYLNGVEVFRSNLPDGPVNSSTLALTTVNTPDETTYFETALATAGSGLLNGSNLVTVELHQASSASSDTGFDLQLLAYGTTEDRVVLACPASAAQYQIGDTIPLEAFVWTGSGRAVSKVEFFVHGQKLGEIIASPYQTTLTGTNYGTYVFTACATLDDGTRIDSAPVNVSVNRPLVTTTLIASNSVWRFLDNGLNQGTNWAQANYVETGWKAGAARLGYGGDGEVTTVNFGGVANNKFITTYFRRAVVIPPGFVYTNLTFHLVRDDGAVVWLNGRELFRSNLPAAPAAITSTTLASASVGNADEQTFFPTVMTVPALLAGTNLFAVEVHQNVANSSDLGFNLEVIGNGYLENDPQPPLAVRFEDGLVELSWPVSAVGWAPYTAPSVVTPGSAWTPLGGMATVVGGRYFIAVTPGSGQQFFRLGRP